MAEFITDDLDLYKKAVEYELEQAQNEEDKKNFHADRILISFIFSDIFFKGKKY